MVSAPRVPPLRMSPGVTCGRLRAVRVPSAGVSMSPEPITALSKALGQLLDVPDAERLVVSCGVAWFVIHAPRAGTAARCVAAPQRHLPDEIKLGVEHVQILRRAGFAKVNRAPCLSRRVELSTEEGCRETAEMLARLFQEVYQRPPDQEITSRLRCGQAAAVTNDQLHNAIRALAKSRGGRERQGMYQALLRARLLLANSAEGAPFSFGTLGGGQTYGVFTEVAAIDLWDPRGLDFEVVIGWDLFPRLAVLKPGSMLINPQGRLGGELYRNEIDALAAACARFGRR